MKKSLQTKNFIEAMHPLSHINSQKKAIKFEQSIEKTYRIYQTQASPSHDSSQSYTCMTENRNSLDTFLMART